MILKTLEIKNYKNIEELKIDFSSNSAGSKNDLMKGYFKEVGKGKILPQVNALIGPNAVGKTNIFFALSFLDWATSSEVNKTAVKKVLIENSVDKTNIDESKFDIDGFIKDVKDGKTSSADLALFLDFKSDITNSLYLKNAKDRKYPIEINAMFWDVNTDTEYPVTLILNPKGMSTSKPEHKFFNKRWVFNFEQTQFNIVNSFRGTENIYDETLNKLAEEIGTDKLLKVISLADASIIGVFQKGNKVLFRKKDTEIDIDFDNFSAGTKRLIFIYSYLLGAAQGHDGIFLIDEIELYLHRELALAVIDTMNMLAVKNDSTSFIFSTHNPMILGENIKFKQVQEIKIDSLTKKHSSVKLSTLFKGHENIEAKYKKGIISKYPSTSVVFDTIYDVIND